MSLCTTSRNVFISVSGMYHKGAADSWRLHMILFRLRFACVVSPVALPCRYSPGHCSGQAHYAFTTRTRSWTMMSGFFPMIPLDCPLLTQLHKVTAQTRGRQTPPSEATCGRKGRTRVPRTRGSKLSQGVMNVRARGHKHFHKGLPRYRRKIPHAIRDKGLTRTKKPGGWARTLGGAKLR